MRVSVVVAAAKIDEGLVSLLKSLESQSRQPDEVIVVVPEGTGDARRLVASSSLETRVVELAKDPGPMRARIFGGIAASGRYVAFIDSDCIAPPQWLESMVAEAERWRADAVAGSLTAANNDKFLSRAQDRSLIAPYPRHKRALLSGDLDLKLIVAANMLVSRAALFDERVIPPSYGRFGFEDLDFAYRLLATGRTVLCSPVLVYHRNRTNLLDVLKRYYEYGRGLPLFRRRCRESLYSKAITALACSFAAVLAAVAALLALGRTMAAALLLALALSPFCAYHASRVLSEGVERLLYPLVDFALAVAAVAGAVVTEVAIVAKSGAPAGLRTRVLRGETPLRLPWPSLAYDSGVLSVAGALPG